MWRNAECNYAELCAILKSSVILGANMLNGFILSAFLVSYVILSLIKQSTVILSVIMLSAYMLNVIMQSFVMLSIDRLNGFKLSVIVVIVVAPSFPPFSLSSRLPSHLWSKMITRSTRKVNDLNSSLPVPGMEPTQNAK
jgi:hypothetical protein